jgi:tetratricopeptide (TPR) repeat protein
VPRQQIAVQHFERAVAIEPTWAEAYARLASAQLIVAQFDDPARRGERADVVRANALRAIELDPNEPVSYTALASVQAYFDWDFPAAENTLRQHLELNPRNGAARSHLAMLLAARGLMPDAISEAERARDLEPLLPDRHGSLGVVRYYARDFAGALNELRRASQVSAAYLPAEFFRGRVLVAMGQVDAGIQAMQAVVDRMPSAQPGWIADLANAYAVAGRTAEVARVRAQLAALESSGTFVSVDNYAYIAANQGDLDEAFRLLDDAVNRRMTNVLWLAVDPRADRLRADPRFAALIARMGVVAR